MGRELAFLAQAKINIRLKLEGRNEGGLHLLSMFNCFVALNDELKITIEESPGVRLLLAGQETPADPTKNLASRAAILFLERFKIPVGLSLSLDKKIPIGSGMGGGSSDAAAVLQALAHFYTPFILKSDPALSDKLPKELAALAFTLGSDVPFFLRGRFARVTGVGEKVERYEGGFFNGLKILMIIPPVSISTAEIYQKVRDEFPILPAKRDLKAEQFGEALFLNTGTDTYDPFPSRTIRASLWRQLQALVENDLEPFVCSTSPEVKAILTALRTLPDTISSVTGSGSAIFVLGKTLDYFEKNSSEAIRNLLAPHNVTVIETQLLSQHPRVQANT